MAVRIRIDARSVPLHHLRRGDAEPQDGAIAPGEADPVAVPQIAQKRELRVAMRRDHRSPALARLRRAIDMTGAKGERLAARAMEHNGAYAEPGDFETGDRPGIGPGPGFDRLPRRYGFRKSLLEQILRQQRLCVDGEPLADEREADDREEGGSRHRNPR
jgi:hypothetical protein